MAAMAMLVAACGTRVSDDVYQAALRAEAARGAAATGGESSGATLEGGVADHGDGPAMAGATEAPGAANPAAPPAPGSNLDGGARPAAGPPSAAIPGLSTEVVGDVIRIGMHVPITGAAPMPTDWTKYLDVAQQYVNESGIHGRTVEFIVKDDKYDAAKAMAACRQLADADPLLVIGHTMPAAENACAGLFNDRLIPYMIRGTTPETLEGRPLTFFGTVPDDTQGRLLADYILTNLDARNRAIGILFQNDQMAARDEFIARLAEAGVTVAVVEEGVPRQADFGATIQKFRDASVELAFLSVPPVDAIKIAHQSSGEGYHPTWLGGGSYWNYNMALESAGMALDGAISFSPWASIDSPAADSFKEVFRQYRPTDEVEDIGLIIWGWAMLVREVLDAAGPDLSRAAVYDALTGFSFDEPYWNPIDYRDGTRRGTDAVAVFRADGQAKRWRQIAPFTSTF